MSVSSLTSELFRLPKCTRPPGAAGCPSNRTGTVPNISLVRNTDPSNNQSLLHSIVCEAALFGLRRVPRRHHAAERSGAERQCSVATHGDVAGETEKSCVASCSCHINPPSHSQRHIGGRYPHRPICASSKAVPKHCSPHVTFGRSSTQKGRFTLPPLMARVRKLPARPRLPDARHAMTKGQHTLKAIPAMTEAHDRLLRYNSLHAHSRVTMSREHRSRSSQAAGTPNPSPKRLPRRLQGIDPSMLPQWRDRSLTGPARQSRRRPSSARSTSASIPSFTDTNDQPNALGIIPGTSSFSTTSFDTSHRPHLSLSVAPPSRSFPGSESGSLSPISPLFPNPSCSGSDAGHHVVQSQSSPGSYMDHLPVPTPVSPAMSAGELSISRSNSSTPSSQGHSAYGPYTPPRGGYGHGRHLTPNPVQGHAYQAASPTSVSVYSRSPHSPMSTRGSSHTAVSPLPSAHPHYPAPAPQPSNADYVPPASYDAPHMGPFGPRTAGLDMPVHPELRLRPGVPAFYPRTAREISHRQDMPPVLPPRIPSSQPRIPIPENDDTPQWMIDAMEGKADAESVNMQNLEADIHWDVFDSLPQVPDQ